MGINHLILQASLSLGETGFTWQSTQWDLGPMNIIIGRFYYDKSTKTLYKYSHDRLEIKDIRCIHQGIEREKKKKKRMAAILIR